MQYIDLSEVNEQTRLRIDLGDIEELAESIREEGLMQPIVLSNDKRLIAGGRRLAAFRLLAKEDPVKYGKIPYITFEDYLVKAGKIAEGESISQATLRKLEIEENVRRKSMTWQEQVIGLVEYHRIARLDAAQKGNRWSQALTGKLLNLSQAHVSNCLAIGTELMNDPESPMWQFSSLLEAIRWKISQKADEASKELMKRISSNRSKMESVRTSTEDRKTILASADDLLKADPASVEISYEDDPFAALGGGATPTPIQPNKEVVSLEECLDFYLKGDCLEQLKKLASETRIDHIICDPPYGIDMVNLAKDDDPGRKASIARVAETHQVKENLSLLPEFLRVAFDVIEETGFLCMWYDLDHHNFLQDTASKIGWKVCRWPFHWVKTSPCLNQAPQYNMTKAVEHCLILRRSERAVLATKVTKNYVLAGAEARVTHPFYKPFDVWQPLIEAVSHEKQTIVDPFAGEGSSLVAAFRLNRIPYGIEIDETHIANGVQTIYKMLNSAPPISLLV